MKDILLKLAKTELHCHLDGSLSLGTVRKLAQMAHIDIPESDAELRRLLTAPQDVENLNEYLKTFDFVRPLLQTKEALYLAAYDVVKQAADENVIYIELRFAPELSMDEGLSAAEVVSAVCEGLRRGEKDFGIIAKALVCGIRQNDMEINKFIFDESKRLGDTYVVGFDFVGNEADYPAEIVSEGID